MSVALPSTVKIAADKADTQPVEVAYTRCLQTGCFASLQVSDDVLKKWRGQSGMGVMTFKTGTGQDVSLPISFKDLVELSMTSASSDLA